MRLAGFILANLEPMLVEWEAFARSIWPAGAVATVAEVRDDAEEILRETALDMQSDQTSAQQAEKSKGAFDVEGRSGIDRASSAHGRGRVTSGFHLSAVVAEYRALRASVLRLWSESEHAPDRRDLVDITRFNESIDQSLTRAVRSYLEQVERDRKSLLDSEQEARRAAEQANRAKDVFLATLSHELRTPLNAIVGWLSILGRADVKKQELEQGLQVIERNTMAQVQLIDDVLDVSRIVSGKMSLNVAPCQLIDVINAGVNAVRPAAEGRQISLNMHLDPTASSFYCDAVRIQQVVWNLISNAVKFTPKGGRVDVTLSREGSSTQIQVSDNGEGISAEVLPHVFDRFRQADSGTRRKVGGLGLGLSIVKFIVEAHGGTVEARSAGAGEGSTFTVRLPTPSVQFREAREVDDDGVREAARHQRAAAIDGGSPSVRLDGLRVLVVDDEPDSRLTLVKVLEGAGAVVVAASSVREAIDALPTARPEVLVSDLGMPDQDGFDLIRQLRDLGHDANKLPAVALTAFAQKDHADAALLAGFQVHVPKPADPHALIAIIASVTGRGR